MMKALLALLLGATGTAVADPPPPNAFVNGGSSPTTNYAEFELYAPAFYHGLFRKNATVLNAGDLPNKRTPVLKHDETLTLLREDDGLLKLFPSTLDLPTSAAIPANVEKLFEDWATAKPPPSAVTVAYGDHGEPEGVSLWTGHTLSPKETRRLHGFLPDSTFVRSIHLHCYAGASLAAPERSRPEKNEEWAKYLKANYRPRSCGLAISDEIEWSWVLDKPGTDWKQSWLTKSFEALRAEKTKQVALDGLKKRMQEDDSILSLPLSTSDYLLMDIFDYFCKVGWPGYPQPNAAPGQKPAPPPGNHAQGKIARGKEEEAHPCEETKKRKELTVLEDYIDERFALTSEMDALALEIARKVLATPDPRWSDEIKNKLKVALKNLDEQQKNIDELRAHRVKNGDRMTPDTRKRLDSTLHEMQQVMKSYQVDLLSVAHENKRATEFKKVYQAKDFQDYLKSDKGKEAYPHLWNLRNQPDPNGAAVRGLGPNEIFMAQVTELKKAQLQRKKLAIAEQARKFRWLSTLPLAGSPYEEIKKTYDSIRECEKSSLD